MFHFVESVLVTQKATQVEDESRLNFSKTKDQGEADDFSLWDRTMGCQIRSTRDIKKGDILMKVPIKAMITPELISKSEAGLAIMSCMNHQEYVDSGFWDFFRSTAVQVDQNMENISNQNATQLLVKILQWRKKAETKCLGAWKRYDEQQLNDKNDQSVDFLRCVTGTISTRAPFLAFLIQQRFSTSECPIISSKEVDLPLKTFAPYARTLPSFVSLPLTWKRNQLALLASSITGMSILQEVAAHTLLLSNEFCSLIDAGILLKFPDLFPRGSFSWDTWLWACSVYMSRNLPMEMYADGSMISNKQADHINKELGVMVPFLDMLNHEREMNQVTWERIPQDEDQKGEDTSQQNLSNEDYPRAILHKRVKKGAQIYTNYGVKANNLLMFDYGFAQIGNLDDKISIGWGLSDCVLKSLHAEHGFECSDNSDARAIQTWWVGSRLELLRHQALRGEQTLSEQLFNGQKLVNEVNRDGVFHPILLTAALIGTMSPECVNNSILLIGKDSDVGIKILKQHQVRLQIYLRNLLITKLESLLSNLSQGLKVHYKHVNIWTKADDGGLNYVDSDNSSGFIGWQQFFDSYAYGTAIEIEKRYYALGSDSCVLALFDGHLKSLQASIDNTTENQFSTILDQLSDLGFILSDEDDDVSNIEKFFHDICNRCDADIKESAQTTDKELESPSKEKAAKNKRSDKHSIGSKSNIPALKLHIGNLPYSSTPSSLFDYFSGIFGKDNVLECHIPTERGSKKSRGFGFVTLPEEVAHRALEPEMSYKIEGRLIKLARSNAVGSKKSNVGNKKSNDNIQKASGRCPKCGFSPKYCDCSGRSPNDSYPRPLPPPSYDRKERSYYEPYLPIQNHYPRDGHFHRRSPSPRYRSYHQEYDYNERRRLDGLSNNQVQRTFSPERERINYSYVEATVSRSRKERRSFSRSHSRSRDRRINRKHRGVKSRSRSLSPPYRERNQFNSSHGSKKKGKNDERRGRKGDEVDDEKFSVSSSVSRERRKKRRKSSRKDHSRRRHRSRSTSRDRRSKSRSISI